MGGPRRHLPQDDDDNITSSLTSKKFTPGFLPLSKFTIYSDLPHFSNYLGKFGPDFKTILRPSNDNFIRNRIAPLTDSRVKTIHEMVLFMKIIKMYGWELMFKKLVEKVKFGGGGPATKKINSLGKP